MLYMIKQISNNLMQSGIIKYQQRRKIMKRPMLKLKRRIKEGSGKGGQQRIVVVKMLQA